MMEWIKYSSYAPPSQGQKVLTFTKGDCGVAYRFNYKGVSIWIACLPSIEKLPKSIRPLICNEPEYWSHIAFSFLPGNYEGKLLVKCEGDAPMDIDQFEARYPEDHLKFVEILIGKR